VSNTGGVGGSNDAGTRAPLGANLGSFQLTYYWVTAEDDFSGAKDTNLYDDSCTVLAVVPSAFAHSIGIEGTGRLSDGRVLNVSGSCGCATSPCYTVVDAQHPWGYGAQNNALVPFRSIAVDRTVIPLGSHVYIAEFDGVTMPGDPSYGQFVHDGCVSADDVGGGIIGKHVDFFAALEAHYRTLDGALGLNSVTVYQGGQRCP
jgi:3D (Asp-Asp-Asp) domain-containing protein